MKLTQKLSMILIIFCIMIVPVKSHALATDSPSFFSLKQIEYYTDETEEEKECTTLLSEPLYKDLKNIMRAIRIAGPILIVFLTSFELISALVSKDDDALKQVTNKLITRLILVAVLFFLPTILDIVLGLFDPNIKTCNI